MAGKAFHHDKVGSVTQTRLLQQGLHSEMADKVIMVAELRRGHDWVHRVGFRISALTLFLGSAQL